MKKEIADRPPPSQIKRLLIRFMDCTAVGLAMALTAYLCAYYNFRDDDNFHWDQDRALHDLASLKGEVDTYRQKNGTYPADFDELREAPPPSGWISPTDPWANPYQYRREKDGYSILSLGRDGKPGGEVFDQDLVVTHQTLIGDRFDWKQAVGLPTLKQFTFDYPTKGMRLACAVAGVFAFFACLIARLDTPRGLLGVLIGLFLTLAACLYVTMIMCALHVPSHH